MHFHCKTSHKENLRDFGVEGRIILKMDLKQIDYRDMKWIELYRMDGFCNHGVEPLGFITEFLDHTNM